MPYSHLHVHFGTSSFGVQMIQLSTIKYWFEKIVTQQNLNSINLQVDRNAVQPKRCQKCIGIQLLYYNRCICSLICISYFPFGKLANFQNIIAIVCPHLFLPQTEFIYQKVARCYLLRIDTSQKIQILFLSTSSLLNSIIQLF